MARPQKAGLDYYPLDVNIDQDDKIALIEAKYGIKGFGVVIKLFNKIYSNNGYYCNWDEDIQLLFSKKVGTDFNQVGEIIKDAIRWKIFDEKIWKKYKILTSKRIQKTYLRAIYKRKEVEIIKEYVVDGVNDIKNLNNVIINSLNDSPSTQSKVKESKVKESKYIDILNFWNSKKIIIHEPTKELLETIEKIIKKKKYKKDDIVQAIKNYSTVLTDEKYFFKYIWSLENFLSRKKALPSFLEGGENWENYKQKNKDNIAIQQAKKREIKNDIRKNEEKRDKFEGNIPKDIEDKIHKLLNKVTVRE